MTTLTWEITVKIKETDNSWKIVETVNKILQANGIKVLQRRKS